MEKWKRSKGNKGTSKEESVLPPTRRTLGQNCLPMEKKKDRKWSFGGFLRRISSGQHNEVSSNDEDITYIPGHMLAKKQTKRTSKMKSKLGKVPVKESSLEKAGVSKENHCEIVNKDTAESIGSSRVDRSQDSICPCNDSVNSRSSEGSLDAVARNSRINKMKARAQAKRDRLCGNSSSEDDSHRSSQSSMRIRGDDIVQNVQRVDSCSRRTRGARTERYIKRISRDDVNSGSDTKVLRSNNSPSGLNDSTILQYFSNPIVSNVGITNDGTRISSPRGSSSSIVRSRGSIEEEKNFPIPGERRYDPRLSDRLAVNYLRDMNENETGEREKLTWPKSNFRRTTAATDEIYGSLRPRQMTKESQQQKMLPPEPPPRSSISRVFSNVYNTPFQLNNVNPTAQRSSRRYYQSAEMPNNRSYNSDNEILRSEHVTPARFRNICQNSQSSDDRRDQTAESYFPESRYENEYCNSLDRTNGPIRKPSIREKREYHEEQENYDPRPYFENSMPPSSNFARTTCSLPKGVQLFSRQRLANFGENAQVYDVPETSRFSEKKPDVEQPIPRPRNQRDNSSCHSPLSRKIPDDDEAERKRSSKNLEDALSELEAIYNSLRLSDEDLLERAEQRSMQEYRDKAAKSAAEHSLKSCSDNSSTENHELSASFQRDTDLRIKDDMAYRRMNPKDRPSSVNGQNSLPQISYLATSPNLSIRESDSYEPRPTSRRGTPDLTRDDLLYRSLSHANNTLRVIEPQPPFGIPLGPVTGSTDSDYLHVKPTNFGQTRSLYIPKSEPDVVSDDLAFRNLRKDRDSLVGTNKNTNIYLQMNSSREPRSSPKNTFTFGTRNKRNAVRSLSADIFDKTRENNDWYDDYARTGHKLNFHSNNVVAMSSVDPENLNSFNFTNNTTKPLDKTCCPYVPENKADDLDINGNRSKSILQRKIQVYVPQETLYNKKKPNSDVDTKFKRNKCDLTKLTVTESENSSPELCDSRRSSISDINARSDKNIQQFTEQEISEYKKLCQDLEKLIEQTDDDGVTRPDVEETINYEDNNSQTEFDEWEKLLNEDYPLPVRITNFDENYEMESTERQVYVPQETLYNQEKPNSDVDTRFKRNKCDLTKLTVTESENSSPELCDTRRSSIGDINAKSDKNIQQFTEQEISKYKKLCQDLEKLIEQTDDDEVTRPDEEETINYEDNNSQTEFDGWEKLLNEDYPLPVRITNFDENYEMESTERDEDRSSSRSIGLDNENLPSSSSRKIDDKFTDDDVLSSASELGIGSNNGSLTDSVYDKFNQLLREVNGVPLIECTNKPGKYPTDELTMLKNNLQDDESFVDSKSTSDDNNIKDDEESTRDRDKNVGIMENASHVLEYRTKVPSPSANLQDEKSKNSKYLNDFTRATGKKEVNNENCFIGDVKTRPSELEIDDDETFACREGEKIEDRRDCNDEAYAFKHTSMHTFRKLCQFTNSITIYDVVLCSFLLTLLITIIVAQ